MLNHYLYNNLPLPPLGNLFSSSEKYWWIADREDLLYSQLGSLNLWKYCEHNCQKRHARMSNKCYIYLLVYLLDFYSAFVFGELRVAYVFSLLPPIFFTITTLWAGLDWDWLTQSCLHVYGWTCTEGVPVASQHFSQYTKLGIQIAPFDCCCSYTRNPDKFHLKNSSFRSSRWQWGKTAKGEWGNFGKLIFFPLWLEAANKKS